jgi:hypothetical protein
MLTLPSHNLQPTPHTLPIVGSEGIGAKAKSAVTAMIQHKRKYERYKILGHGGTNVFQITLS